MSARIRVTAGPWPERIGCEGVIVDDPGDGVYPFDKPLGHHAVILLDNDPLGRTRRRDWTCVMSTRDLLWLPATNQKEGE